MAIGIGLSGIFTAKSAVPPPPAPINLFTQDLTLAANRTHDLNGNSVTFLKSNFEFRAVDALSNTIGFRYRNLANTQNIFSIKNQGRVEINGSDALVLLTGTSYTAYWLNTPTAQMSMFNEGANYVGFRQNTSDLLFQRGGGSASETHTSISVSNGSWNFGLNWASATAMLNVGMGTLNQARLGVQAINGNTGERVFGLRNHTNTGWAFEVRNNLDIIANGGTNNDNITSIGYLSGKLGNANTFYGRSAGQSISTGEDNTMIGYTAGASCSTGIQNVYVGTSAGNNSNGSSNVYIGALAGAYNTGSGNMIIGSGFAAASGTGSQNCFIGAQVALFASSGAENCAMGRASLLSLGTGSQNIAMGQDSGAYKGIGFDSNANPSNSIFLGAYSRANDSNQTNQIVIGHNATGEGSNTARIGNSSVTELHVGGNGASLALKSPNGTTWRISVDNTGTLVIV